MGVSGQLHAPASLYPGKGPPVPIVQEAGWAPEPVWTLLLKLKKKSNSHLTFNVKNKGKHITVKLVMCQHITNLMKLLSVARLIDLKTDNTLYRG
jgi:hypothetical protein